MSNSQISGVDAPELIARDMPPPGTEAKSLNYTVMIPIDGVQTPVTFKLGKLISDKSLFVNVYELIQIPVILKGKGMIPKELGEDLVIKVLKRDPAYIAAIEAKNPTSRQGIMTTSSPAC